MLNPELSGDALLGRGLAQAIVDTIREPLLVLDTDLSVMAASRSFYLSFKVRPEDVQRRPLYALGSGQWNIPELRVLLEGVVAMDTAMEGYEVEQIFPGIGHRTMLLNARRVFNDSGARALVLLAIEDITQRRIAERKLGALMIEKETLLLEVPHRVSNSLQIIASILSLKAQTVNSEEVREQLQDAHRRVMSVATVHRHLQATPHLERVDMGPYLQRLCNALADSMIGDSRQIGLKVETDGAGAVSSNEAVSLGLIVTELVINALKHAFSDGRSTGSIVVTYGAGPTSWRLTVSDDGVGQPAHVIPGLGTGIVEALARQLQAEIAISPASPGTMVALMRGALT